MNFHLTTEGFSQRLRTERERAGLSQRELAKRIHVAPATVALWEGKKITEISANNLGKLAMLFNVNPFWLLYDHVTLRAMPSTKDLKTIEWLNRDPDNRKLLELVSDPANREMLELVMKIDPNPEKLQALKLLIDCISRNDKTKPLLNNSDTITIRGGSPDKEAPKYSIRNDDAVVRENSAVHDKPARRKKRE